MYVSPTKQTTCPMTRRLMIGAALFAAAVMADPRTA